MKVLHRRCQDQGHFHLGGKRRKDFDILLQHFRINGVNPSACSDLMVDEDDGGVIYTKTLGKVLRIF